MLKIKDRRSKSQRNLSAAKSL